jgi:hypothetical protein
MKTSLSVFLAVAAALSPARHRVRRATVRVAAARKTYELGDLKVGQRLSAKRVSEVFEGERGAKCFLDAGVVQTLPDGSKVKVPTMLRMAPFAKWQNETDAYGQLGRQLAGGNLAGYVAAARKANRQVVLEPFPVAPQRRGGLPLSSLEVGAELRGAKVVGLSARAAFVEVPVCHDKARSEHRRRKRLHATLIGRRLPSGWALASATVKRAGTTTVVREGAVLDAVYCRKVEPASGRLEVSIQVVDADSVAAEKAKARETRTRRARRLSATKRLKKGDVVNGSVVRRERYGCVVDFGASAFGLVVRGDRDLDFLSKGDAVRATVSEVSPRDGFPHAPKVTLEILADAEEEAEAAADWVKDALEDEGKPTSPDERRGVAEEEEEDDDDEDDFADLDSLDDIEDALGLDSY